MWHQIAFGASLIAVAAGLFWHHLRVEALWAEEAARWPDHATDDQRQATRLRHRRRLQGSLLIGLVGLAMMGGTLLASPLQLLLFWCSVLLLVLSIIWLGLSDLWSTRQHMRAMHEQHRRATEQIRAELEAEIARFRR